VDEIPHALLSRAAGPRSTFIAEFRAGAPDAGESCGTRLVIPVAGTRTPHVDNLWRQAPVQPPAAFLSLRARLLLTILPVNRGAHREVALESDTPLVRRAATAEAGRKAGRDAIPLVADEAVGAGRGCAWTTRVATKAGGAEQPGLAPYVFPQRKSLARRTLFPRSLAETEANRRGAGVIEWRAHEARLALGVGVALAGHASFGVDPHVDHAQEWLLAIILDTTAPLVGLQRIQLIPVQDRLHVGHDRRREDFTPPPPTDGASNGKEQPQRK
jgi:hypothetical protein